MSPILAVNATACHRAANTVAPAAIERQQSLENGAGCRDRWQPRASALVTVILAALALFDTDHHLGAVDIADLERHHFAGTQAAAIGEAQQLRTRIGFRTTNAKMAAMILSADATMNTAVQPPVAAVSTLPNGTRSAAVPLAV
jgi:hypothetical protein